MTLEHMHHNHNTKRNFCMPERETVLITGGSGGLGEEFAKLFAQKHFHVVLAARSEDRMKALASKLNSRYGRSAAGAFVEYIVADLSRPDGAEMLWAKVRRRGLSIDQLVNNAGAGKVGRVVDADPEIMKGLISLNITSLTVLSRLAGAEMVKKRHGRILNISSTAGMFPDPYFNVYGPSKAYVLALTEAMRGELSGTGVTVTALCPGPVRTNWAVNAGKAYPAMAADPQKVARIGFEAMQKGKLCVVPGAGTSAGTFFLTRCLPRSLRVRIGALWQQAMIRKGR